MPPKPKITREMIVEAAFEIIRSQGIDNLNARSVSTVLNCSTQPVMYHFNRVDELRRAVYERADLFHSEYLMKDEHGTNIGMRYIRFAFEEKNLFRFLFQTNEYAGKSLQELLSVPEIAPIIEGLAKSTSLEYKQGIDVFRQIFLFVHGYASMFANNAMTYKEEEIAADLATNIKGIMSVWRGENK